VKRWLALAGLSAFFAAVGLPAGHARADEPSSASKEPPERRAARAFHEGQAAFEAGDFRRAAAAFETAYAAKPHHAALWNAARSWQRAGEDLLAANLLERYLREAPSDAPDRDEATQALATVSKRLGRVQLQLVGVTNVKIDGEARPQKTIFVAPGEHVATATADGEAVGKVFSVSAGEIISVTLSREARRAPAQTESASTTRVLPPWLVYAGGGVAVAGGALTTIFGLDTLSERDAFREGDQTQARLDAGYAAQARTNVALGVTAGIAALTLVAALFFVDWGSDTPRSGRATRTRRDAWLRFTP
jgi:hypothetical protein